MRTGDSVIKSYVSSYAGSWYNLRLVSGTEGEPIDLSSVQRVTVNVSGEENSSGSAQIFTRRNKSWVVTGFELKNPNIPAVENYIRAVLNTEADGFSDEVLLDDPRLDANRITLELGYGRIITIRLSQGDVNGRVFAHVVHSDNDVYSRYVYSIPSWAAQGLFASADSFELQR